MPKKPYRTQRVQELQEPSATLDEVAAGLQEQLKERLRCTGPERRQAPPLGHPPGDERRR